MSLVMLGIVTPLLSSGPLVMWRSVLLTKDGEPTAASEALSLVTLPSMLVYAARAARLGKLGELPKVWPGPCRTASGP